MEQKNLQDKEQFEPKKITLENVSKLYNEEVAVADLDLKIEKGDVFTLLGPSGCGKTTTLYAIAGLIEVTEGEIWIGDQLVSSSKEDKYIPPEDRNISMVFQDYAIYPHKTVFDNIAFPLECRGMEDEVIKEKVESTAGMLQITELLDKKPGQLSGGQRQRVAVGRSIVRKPNAFLMDEPLANLDAKLRVEARTMLQNLQKELGITTVYVTHDQVEAMSISDQIAVLNKGYLQQIGDSKDLYNSPANKFVGGFIGSPSMNFFEVTLKESEGLWIESEIFELKLPDSVVSILKDKVGETLDAGIRPKRFFVSSEAQKENSFSMKPSLIEDLGDSKLAHFEYDDKEFLAEISPDITFTEGKSVQLTVDREKIHLFDKGGENIIL